MAGPVTHEDVKKGNEERKARLMIIREEIRKLKELNKGYPTLSPSPKSAHQGPVQGGSGGLGFPENSKYPEGPAAGVRSSQSSRSNSGSNASFYSVSSSSPNFTTAVKELQETVSTPPYDIVELRTKLDGVISSAAAAEQPVDGYVDERSFHSVRSHPIVKSSLQTTVDDLSSIRDSLSSGSIDPSILGLLGHTLQRFEDHSSSNVSALTVEDDTRPSLTKEALENHNQNYGSRSSSLTIPSGSSSQLSSTVSSLSVSSIEDDSEKKVDSVNSGSIGPQNTAPEGLPPEKPIGEEDIRVIYHFTGEDGTIQNHEEKHENYCHSFSADASTANTTQDSGPSSSSEDATPPKYHTVSVAWGNQVTAQEAGVKCMEEYLGVMGLQESPDHDNVMQVIALLEKEWMPDNSELASSGQEIDARLAALFEKIPINAHPDQSEDFSAGAEKAFMTSFKLALGFNNKNNQTPVGHGRVGIDRTSRLSSARSKLSKIASSAALQDTKRQNPDPPRTPSSSSLTNPGL